MHFDLEKDYLLKKMEKDGFVVIKNVFTKEEVLTLRKILTNHFKKNQSTVNFLTKYSRFFLVKMLQPFASVHIPEIWWIFSHPKVLKVMKILLEDTCVYTNVSDAQIASKGGWHKDDGTNDPNSHLKGYFKSHDKNIKENDKKRPYELEDCKVYKVAFYLQDHSKNSSGLSVRPGSHKTDVINSNQPSKYLKTRVGDIVIFDVRTSHSGRLDPIPLDWNSSNIWLRHVFQLFVKIPLIGRYFYELITTFFDILFEKKYSLFWVYGADNKWTTNYTKSMCEGMVKQVRNSNFILPNIVKEPLIKAGIKTLH